MKNVFLIHGSVGKPFENWFPWLENELAKREIPCTIPTFPTPNHQNFDCWAKLIDYYYDNGIINEDTILVGHSCGAVCIIKYLIERKIKVAAFITVSGYNHFYSGIDFMDGLNSSFYFDFDKCKIIGSLVKTRLSYAGDDDPFIPQEKLKEFSEVINSNFKLVHKAGHFNQSAGYLKFEAILDDILQL